MNNTEAILLAFEDITNRKQLENQKDDFIGIVSHELRTPLTSIKAFSQLLEKHHNQSKDKKGMFYLSKMTNQMERLTQLMASFVNVYKIQNGKLDLNKKKFPIDDLVRDIVSDFRLTSKIHKLLSNLKANVNVFADRERIGQVLINLISNAIKYSPDAKEIIVTTSKDKTNAIISVLDFGLGIPKGEQGKIFDRFFRVKAKKDNGISGLGLGLYISKEIVNLHKGKIWVESNEGKGSLFHFTLPIKHY